MTDHEPPEASVAACAQADNLASALARPSEKPMDELVDAMSSRVCSNVDQRRALVRLPWRAAFDDGGRERVGQVAGGDSGPCRGRSVRHGGG